MWPQQHLCCQYHLCSGYMINLKMTPEHVKVISEVPLCLYRISELPFCVCRISELPFCVLRDVSWHYLMKFVSCPPQRLRTTYPWWQRTLRPRSADTKPRTSLCSALQREGSRPRRWVAAEAAGHKLWTWCSQVLFEITFVLFLSSSLWIEFQKLRDKSAILFRSSLNTTTTNNDYYYYYNTLRATWADAGCWLNDASRNALSSPARPSPSSQSDSWLMSSTDLLNNEQSSLKR